MRDKRGLRGKSRRDADDRAVERAKAAADKERVAREAAIEVVNTTLDTHEGNIDTLQAFKNRQGGFAPENHKHGSDDILGVNWSKINGVPNFATRNDISDLRRWVSANFRKL